MRAVSVGSLPPAWGGSTHGGVATLHATLLEGFLDPRSSVEVVGVVPPAPLRCELRIPVFVRPTDEPTGPFYERLLAELEPDVVIMHHFAHTIGITHARLRDAPPAIGIAHSWHNITFSSREGRQRAIAVTEEALSGLDAVVGMSRHCLCEGEELGLSYPPLVETIYHPLQPLYSEDLARAELERERDGVACLGSLIPRKDPATLVRAAKSLRGLDVTFAGHGELDRSLRSLIASLSLGDRVDIRDLDDRQVRDLLLGSEAMCLASRSETFGLAYIEALACGTPVVGFGPTLREIQRQLGVEVGEPLDSTTPDQVAAAIERVRAREWDRTELRRRTLAAFDLRSATGRYERLIERVSSPGRTRRGPSRRTRPDGSDPTIVCILGMSRAGTSLTARILNLAGVYLGPEEELLGGELRQLADEGKDVVARARTANPEGFWEHYRLMRLNERILRHLGGSWREPPRLEPGWEASECLDPLREEARALIAESFEGHELWGWKDPRNSLTLPFWKRLLPEMRYVICVRGPIDVAASLESRDDIPLERGVRLWLTYLLSALVNTSGQPRLLISYESYFSDPARAIERLARFAGRAGVLNDRGTERRLMGAIDERLWRNRLSGDDLANPGRVPREAAALFRVAELLGLVSERGGVGTPAGGLNAAADLYADGLLSRLSEASPWLAP